MAMLTIEKAKQKTKKNFIRMCDIIMDVINQHHFPGTSEFYKTPIPAQFSHRCRLLVSAIDPCHTTPPFMVHHSCIPL